MREIGRCGHLTISIQIVIFCFESMLLIDESQGTMQVNGPEGRKAKMERTEKRNQEAPGMSQQWVNLFHWARVLHRHFSNASCNCFHPPPHWPNG